MSIGPVRIYDGPCGEPGCRVQSLHGHAEATFPMNFIPEEGADLPEGESAKSFVKGSSAHRRDTRMLAEILLTVMAATFVARGVVEVVDGIYCGLRWIYRRRRARKEGGR